MNIRLTLLSSLFILCFSSQLFAQQSKFKAVFLEAKDTNQPVSVTLLNDNVYSGMVVSVNDESVGIETDDGVFNIRYDRIKNAEIIKDGQIIKTWKENPSANKLFIFQTGKLLEAGSGYYQNTFIFFSNFAYGISDYVSVDAGFSMLPGAGIDNQLYTAGLKVGTSVSSTFFVSGSLKYYTILDSSDGFFTVFGSATYAKNKLDVTASLGVGLSGEDSDLITVFGAQYRVSDRFAFLSENIILPTGGGSEPFLSFGGRVIATKSAFDLGFFTISGDFIAPFLSYTIKF